MKKRISRESDLPALRALWHTAFGDEQSYIDHFFRRYWRPERMLVLDIDAAPRAMAAWFDMPLVTAEGEAIPAAYLYAVATEAAYRGRGLAGKLLDFAAETLSQLGFAALTTVPAEPSLHGFFARYGFQEQFVLTRRQHRPGGRRAVRLEPIDAGEYGRLREARLAGRFHVACSQTALAYQAGACALSGGGLYRVGADGCACAEVWDDALIIKELLTQEGQEDAAADALLARHPTARCEVRIPCSPDETGEAFAMTRWLAASSIKDGQAGYFGLAFD